MRRRCYCERNAFQPNPETFRTHLRPGRNQSGRLFDRSRALRAAEQTGGRIGARVERVGAPLCGCDDRLYVGIYYSRG